MAGCAARCATAAAQLNALGIGRGDRRGDRAAERAGDGDGLRVASRPRATTAPLNPAYRADELDFYLTDIGAKAILVAEDENGPAVAVAERLGIAVLGWSRCTTRRPAASASKARRSALPAAPARPRPDDIALLLHTSGTTSRPKLVPLSHANLAASAAHIGATLGLTRRTTAASTSCRCSTSTG